jgi:hypothetical protein
MSFSEKMSTLAGRAPALVDHLETEEATKNALIMPFISALGYDVFDPKEVIPEYTADVGTKKGEKVDYAIMRDDEVVMLIECKKATADLDQAAISQLYRYFTVTKTRIAVVTNGLQYQFFSDLDEQNKMDSRPFLDLDLLNLKDNILAEVAKLGKEKFDLERMLVSAIELKFTGEAKKLLATQLEDPDEDWVKFFFTRVNPGGRFVTSAKEASTPLVKKAFQQFISERVNDRLRSALESEISGRSEETEEDLKKIGEEHEEQVEDGIITTDEELEGYRIVKAIVAKVVDLDRVSYRDSKTYFTVILDDSNRKCLCRLWFNRRQKYIGLFDQEKNEERCPIEGLNDIYKYSERLRDAVLRLEGAVAVGTDSSGTTEASATTEKGFETSESGHRA